MYNELSLRYRLRLSDFDRCQHLLPSAVLDLFTDIATVQAVDMGMGLEDVRARGLMWAVIREKFEIVQQPKPHQEVVVRTWPHTPTRFSFQRDYDIRTLDGELLVKATSEWVLMNFVERTFAAVRDEYSGPLDFLEERCFPKKARKIHDFETTAEGALVVPAWTDVDVNGHVNNAKYANFVWNVIDVPEGYAVHALQMDFRKEVMCGEPLTVYAEVGKSEQEPAEECSLAPVYDLRAKGLDAAGDIMFACTATLSRW